MNAQQYPRDLLKGWTVVVVDDEPDSLMVATFILRHHGAQVYDADNGLAALMLARQHQPNFIISDLSMPGIDGWELLNTLKRDTRTLHIPVIALTAHAMLGDRERAIAAGFHNYLTKPLTASTFMGQLMRLLMDIPNLNAALDLRQDASVRV